MSPRPRKAILALIAALAAASAGTLGADGHDWRAERWTVEPFTQTLSGGPDAGPVRESGRPVRSLCQLPDGRLVLAFGQQIDIVDGEGMRWPLAGDGVPGFRDGAAERARFRMGIRAHYSLYQIFCADDGSVLVPDSGNGRVRRLRESGGRWLVETIAGGGTLRLRAGQSTPATKARLGGTLAVAEAADGTIYIATPGVYYRLRDGILTNMGGWPPSAARFPGSGKPVRLNPFAGDVGTSGLVHFVSRTPDVVIRIDRQGRAHHVAGVTGWRRKPHHLGDLTPREAFFDTPSSAYADVRDEAMFLAGGDEYNVRRVPTDGRGTTATLMQDGRWHLLPRHPNRYRGAAVFRPRFRGEPPALRILRIAPLVGRDRAGHLYAKMNHWSGMTQYVEGQGLLPTRIFHLRRTATEGGR